MPRLPPTADCRRSAQPPPRPPRVEAGPAQEQAQVRPCQRQWRRPSLLAGTRKMAKTAMAMATATATGDAAPGGGPVRQEAPQRLRDGAASSRVCSERGCYCRGVAADGRTAATAGAATASPASGRIFHRYGGGGGGGSWCAPAPPATSSGDGSVRTTSHIVGRWQRPRHQPHRWEMVGPRLRRRRRSLRTTSCATARTCRRCRWACRRRTCRTRCASTARSLGPRGPSTAPSAACQAAVGSGRRRVAPSRRVAASRNAGRDE